MLQNKLQMCQRGNWIINLFVILCYLSTIISLPCTEQSNNTNPNLPADWPCSWNDGVIPFTFDMFSSGSHRLISLVNKGHDFIQMRSCLRFEEYDPTVLAKKTNFTYLYYTFSGVLESCCLKFYTKPNGRRLVLITPLCTLPAETGHATLHAMGLFHEKNVGFHKNEARAVMFPEKCVVKEETIIMFEGK